MIVSMVKIRIWALVCFLSASACATGRIQSRYQFYRLRTPSTATGFANLGGASASVMARSYQPGVRAPIQLTASDGDGLELRELRVRAVIEGPLAFTELKMSFHNARKRELEGSFAITLPQGASVARLAMKSEGDWHEAEMVAKMRGREVHGPHLHKQVEPVLLEASIGNQIRARVYPIPANAEKQIIISYSQELPASGEYRIPLAGLPQLRKLDVDVQHGQKRERFVRHDYLADEDFRLHTESAANVALRNDDFLMLRWVPDLASTEEVPSRLHVLVDSSASSSAVYGLQVQALEDLAQALASAYGEELELEVACFDNEVYPVFDGRAAKYGAAQSEALLTHGAIGASNLQAAVEWAAQRSGRLLWIGDGIATTGQRDASQLQSQLAKRGGPSRVDVLALSNSKEAAVLEALTQTPHRRAGVILPSEATAKEWARHMGRSAPVPVSIRVSGATWVWPKTRRPSAEGEAVTAFVKVDKAHYERRGTVTVEQTSRVGVSELELPVVEAEQDLLQRAWVRLRLSEMIAQEARNSSALRRSEIELLSQLFRILMPHTSLMLETEWGYDRSGISRRGGPVLTVDATGLRRVRREGNLARESAWRELMVSPRHRITSPPPEGRRSADQSAGELADNLPVPGSTFETTPSVGVGGQDEFIGCSGALSPGSRYVVDGVNTTGFSTGEAVTFYASDEAAPERQQWIPGMPRADIRRFRKIRAELHHDAFRSALATSLRWYAESPTNLLAIAALGESLQANAHYKLAARAYASILDLYPRRADMHRVAAGYLSRLGPEARKLRTDALRVAQAARSDHAHGVRLLAMALAMEQKEAQAIALLLRAIYQDDTLGRFRQIRPLLRHEVAVIAGAWLGRRRGDSKLIKRMLEPYGIMVPMEPVHYAVLSWESDVAKLDLDVGPPLAVAEERTSGRSIDIGELGYGPEAILLDGDPDPELRFSVDFSEQSMTGYVFAQLQVVSLDAAGELRVDTRPFVALDAQERVAMGGF